MKRRFNRLVEKYRIVSFQKGGGISLMLINEGKADCFAVLLLFCCWCDVDEASKISQQNQKKITTVSGKIGFSSLQVFVSSAFFSLRLFDFLLAFWP